MGKFELYYHYWLSCDYCKNQKQYFRCKVYVFRRNVTVQISLCLPKCRVFTETRCDYFNTVRNTQGEGSCSVNTGRGLSTGRANRFTQPLAKSIPLPVSVVIPTTNIFSTFNKQSYWNKLMIGFLCFWVIGKIHISRLSNSIKYTLLNSCFPN